MTDQIGKTQILETTINVLANICVPVRMREITEKIDGAINNLLIVQEMIRMEEQMNGKTAEEPAEDEPGTGGEETQETE